MSDFSEMVSRQKAFVIGGATRSVSWRREQLKKLLAEMRRQKRQRVFGLGAAARRANADRIEPPGRP